MYTYDDYYDDYEEEVINESALDMAMDMSDRYGVAIEDAYDFMCGVMEGSLKDPHKRVLREVGRAYASKSAESENSDRRSDFVERHLDGYFDAHPNAKMKDAIRASNVSGRYYDNTRRPAHYSMDNTMKQQRLQAFKKGLTDPDYRGRYDRVSGKPIDRGIGISGMDKFSPEYYRNGRK